MNYHVLADYTHLASFGSSFQEALSGVIGVRHMFVTYWKTGSRLESRIEQEMVLKE